MTLTARRLARSFPVTGAVFVTSPYSGVAYAAVVCGSREDAYRAGLLAERRRHAPD